MRVLDGRSKVGLGCGSCPDSVYVVGWIESNPFVECEEQSGFLRLEDVAVEDQGDELTQVTVSS